MRNFHAKGWFKKEWIVEEAWDVECGRLEKEGEGEQPKERRSRDMQAVKEGGASLRRKEEEGEEEGRKLGVTVDRISRYALLFFFF